MQFPALSVIMPVFNTGPYLHEAVRSVQRQQPLGEGSLPEWELIVVDDHSTDPATLAILDTIAAYPGVRVVRNLRSKGAAGARNTGIDCARGSWIGFLDSDDVWFPHAIALRWEAVRAQPEARWIGARFRLLRPHGDGGQVRFGDVFSVPPGAGPALPVRLERLCTPVAAFAESCLVGIMTVLLRKDLLLEKGGFNETLVRSEDYHLWFRCALDNDLWLVPQEIAYYRIHQASLTHGNAPRHLHEDAMLDLLGRQPEWQGHRELLLKRYDLVMQDHCYFYRQQRQFRAAARSAWRWLRRRPLRMPAWKELLASGLRFS